jgi:adenylate cyclase
MTTDDVKRKLTAIFSADVVGYSRLMGEDELATIQTLTSYKETMTKLIKHYRGRVLDAIGDNLMAEFASVVDAVQCAVEVQQVLSSKNEELPENRKMLFRIGINLGDVIEEGDRIYGDGVNIAARVESLAEGGGVCISGSAFEQIENKLALGYQYMGEHTVKNIAKPVKVYRVPMGPVTEKEKKIAIRGWHKVAVGAVAIVILAGIATVLWHYYWRPSPPPIEVASVERMAFQLPEKPSIAVLPFTNMSEDPKQEYFSEGITENIITALSKCTELFVIARTSTSKYKGKPVELRQVAEELGVRYVLEGSVQRAGGRVRITAQLCDAINGHHLWADRYDGDVVDMFALQDDIAVKTLKAVQVTLTEGKKEYLFGESTDNLDAFEKYSEAMFKTYRNIGRRRQLLREAIELDPKFVSAYVWLGWSYMFGVWIGFTKSPEEDIEKAYQLTQKALSLNDSAASPHSLLGKIHMTKRKWKESLEEGKRAVAANHNSAWAHMWLGCIYGFYGKPEESIYWLEKAFRLDPYPEPTYFSVLAMTYTIWGRYDEAIEAYKKVLHMNPGLVIAYIGLALNYSLSGRKEKAQEAAAEVLRRFPGFNAEYHIKAMTYPDEDRFIDALHDAGLPVDPPESMCFWKRLNKQENTE